MPSPREPTPGDPVGAARTGGAPEGARRTFTDRHGTLWHVREERIPLEEWTTADVESRQSGYGVGWLVFEREGVRRRVRLYPADWQRASDGELARLCGRARHVERPVTGE